MVELRSDSVFTAFPHFNLCPPDWKVWLRTDWRRGPTSIAKCQNEQLFHLDLLRFYDQETFLLENIVVFSQIIRVNYFYHKDIICSIFFCQINPKLPLTDRLPVFTWPYVGFFFSVGVGTHASLARNTQQSQGWRRTAKPSPTAWGKGTHLRATDGVQGKFPGGIQGVQSPEALGY